MKRLSLFAIALMAALLACSTSTGPVDSTPASGDEIISTVALNWEIARGTCFLRASGEIFSVRFINGEMDMRSAIYTLPGAKSLVCMSTGQHGTWPELGVIGQDGELYWLNRDGEDVELVGPIHLDLP